MKPALSIPDFPEFAPRDTWLNLLCQSSVGFIILDLDGRITQANDAFARIAGHDDQSLLGLRLDSLLHPDDARSSSAMMLALLAQELAKLGPHAVIERRYLTPRGATAYVRDSLWLLADECAKVTAIAVVTEDRTWQQLAERALIESERVASIGRLSASIAHELKNPLQSVMDFLFLMLHSDQVGVLHEYARRAESEMNRVAQITTQTLRFSRPSASPAPMPVTDILEGALALFAGRLHDSGTRILTNYNGDGGICVARGGEIRQVVINLLANALDAMGDRGTLVVKVRAARLIRNGCTTGVRVAICDNGGGIPVALREKIFEPFFSTKEDHGNGLGLWISSEIVRREGGVLRVRSATSGPHRGTIMSMLLPAAAPLKVKAAA